MGESPQQAVAMTGMHLPARIQRRLLVTLVFIGGFGLGGTPFFPYQAYNAMATIPIATLGISREDLMQHLQVSGSFQAAVRTFGLELSEAQLALQLRFELNENDLRLVVRIQDAAIGRALLDFLSAQVLSYLQTVFRRGIESFQQQREQLLSERVRLLQQEEARLGEREKRLVVGNELKTKIGGVNERLQRVEAELKARVRTVEQIGSLWDTRDLRIEVRRLSPWPAPVQRILVALMISVLAWWFLVPARGRHAGSASQPRRDRIEVVSSSADA